jgi:hypothetical protein
MSTNYHGPWTTELNNAGGLLVRDTRRRILAGCDADTARLIAVAPELLAIVADITVDWPDLGDNDNEVSGADLVDYMAGKMLEIRAVLAKVAP